MIFTTAIIEEKKRQKFNNVKKWIADRVYKEATTTTTTMTTTKKNTDRRKKSVL